MSVMTASAVVADLELDELDAVVGADGRLFVLVVARIVGADLARGVGDVAAVDAEEVGETGAGALVADEVAEVGAGRGDVLGHGVRDRGDRR